MEKFIMAGDCAVRIFDSQKGEKTVVLLHGYLESIEVWDTLIPELKRELRVVAIDLPGHGISEVKSEVHTMEFVADVVAEAMKSLGVASAVVVGHSMGGYVAVAFADRHPDMLSGLVLLHSTPFADSDDKRKHRDREIELVLAGKKDLLANITPGAGFAVQNRRRFASCITELADQVLLTDEDGIVALLRGMSERIDRSEMMRNLKVPQMIVLGRFDDYITADVAKRLIEEQPQAEVLWMENSGHMSLVEEPVELAESLKRFTLNA